MEFFVEFEEELNIVSGRIDGDITREIAKNYFTRVGEVVIQEGCERVLTDVRSASLVASEEDMESLSRELAQIGLSASYRRAIVLSDDVSRYKVWENYCFTAGHKNLKLFVDCSLAKEWLSEQ